MSEWIPGDTPPEKSGACLLRCTDLDDPTQEWLVLAMRLGGYWIEMYQGSLKRVLDNKAVLFWQSTPKAPMTPCRSQPS